MSNYINGRAKEYRVKKKLEQRGFVVIRSAGSHSFADLVAINPKKLEIVFIQCKPKNFSENKAKSLRKNFAWIEDTFECRFEVI